MKTITQLDKISTNFTQCFISTNKKHKVKGRPIMTNQLKKFAMECVENYAEYDKLDGFHSLFVQDLPEFVQNEFAALIMGANDDWASEANGPDNHHWKTKMLPALLRYLKNSTDQDEAIEFNNTWRHCVTEYMQQAMQELINDSLSDAFN